MWQERRSEPLNRTVSNRAELSQLNRLDRCGQSPLSGDVEFHCQQTIGTPRQIAIRHLRIKWQHDSLDTRLVRFKEFSVIALTVVVELIEKGLE